MYTQVYNMSDQYISTTELREQSSKVISRLKAGEDVTLIHRSRIVGVIKPIIVQPRPFHLLKFKKSLAELKQKRIIPRSQRDRVYREHLLEKHGKNIF